MEPTRGSTGAARSHRADAWHSGSGAGRGAAWVAEPCGGQSHVWWLVRAGVGPGDVESITLGDE
jgi:hypothetical protein